MLTLWGLHRIYRSYIIDRHASELALEMHLAEEKADDDLQEQIEIQEELVRSSHFHNLATLSLVEDIVGGQGASTNHELADIDSRARRITALSVMQEYLYLQGDGPRVDLNKFTEAILGELLAASKIDPTRVVTINEVHSELVPAHVASSLAVIISELTANSLEHAFVEEDAMMYLQVSLKRQPASDDAAPVWNLSVIDSGCGLQEDASKLQRQGSGMQVIEALVNG